MTPSATVRLALFLLLLQPMGPGARCQDLTSEALQKIAETPTNLWQQRARASKPIPATESERSIRSARDAYADSVLGVGMPIEQLLARHLAYNNPGPKLPTGNDGIVPPFPDETVVVGTFDSFDVVLTTSHQTIYSEMHVGVDRVIYPMDSRASGRVIDIIEPGGTVSLPDGKPISFKIAPRAYGLVPHSRYVLFLRYVGRGDFYLLYDSIAIENGFSRPNSPDAVNLSKVGKWMFRSMDEDELIESLSKQLQLQHQ